MADIFDSLQGVDTSEKSPQGDIFDAISNEEGYWKSKFRTLLQLPQGAAEATTPGILAGLWQLLGQGESLDPEELDRIRAISEREGIPFDEEKYMQAVQQASGTIPTVRNIAGGIEEKFGVPLEPKTPLQKAVRLGSAAATFQPGSLSQKAVAGITAPGVAYGLEEAGVPEPFAELAGLAAGGGTGVLTPEIGLGTATKPSGMTSRGFESLKSPREVSANKMAQINEKISSDFKGISDKIISESPVGKTFENLRNDPTFKQESRELLNQAQVIADELPGEIKTIGLKKAIADQSAKSKKGFIDSEYDKQYAKFVKQQLEEFPEGPIRPGQLVEQYRKNNGELGEYFEPGQSKAFNRAKRDAILDQNRAIAQFMEEQFPDSELVPVFKEGNARWSKIMDAEAIDNFTNDLFDGKVNFKKGEAFFEDKNTERVFKRALGDKYPQFEQLMKDTLRTEAPYNMLRVAKEKGWSDLFNAAKYYVIHPHIATTKGLFDLAKGTYKFAINSILDKPKIAFAWRKGINALKKGDFKTAEREFKALNDEVSPVEKTSAVEVPETIEVKPEK